MLYPVLTQSRLLSDLSGVWNFKLDNGKGFEPGKIIDKPEENGIRFSHVGIANVEERIRLYFGNQYGIQIDSAIGKGTRVLLTLPVKEKTEMP